MKPNPDATRGPSVKLTEDILEKLGLTCLWLDTLVAGQEQHTKLLLKTITGRCAIGPKIWFRSRVEAEKVRKACLSRCFEAYANRDAVIVKLPADQVADLVRLVAHSLGIAAILDADVATTFDSIHQRIEQALARMQRDGSMKKINREYAELRSRSRNPDHEKPGTSAGTKGTSLPSYSLWLVERLKIELLNCTDLVHITRL
jgi:hypothetical protein